MTYDEFDQEIKRLWPGVSAFVRQSPIGYLATLQIGSPVKIRYHHECGCEHQGMWEVMKVHEPWQPTTHKTADEAAAYARMLAIQDA